MNFDDMKNKAKDMVGQHGDKADGAVDKGSDMAKDRFGHDEQVDSAADKAKGYLGNEEGQGGQEQGNN